MIVTLKDFAKERTVERETINIFLKRHPDLDKQTWIENRNKVFDSDSEVYQVLDKQYPVKQLVLVQDNIETIKELAAARQELADERKKINELQDQITKMSVLVAQANSIKLIAEMKEKELEDLKLLKERSDQQYEEEKSQLKDEILENKKIIEDNQRKLEELQNQLKIEQDKKWYHKLFNK